MVIRPSGFNIYLLFVGALIGLTGCQTPESKRESQIATVRIHLESTVEIPDKTEVVTICRSAPMVVNVVKEPFLNESLLAMASLVEEHGGFAIKLQFNHLGQTALEQCSATNPNRRFAIRSQFGIEPNAEDRWLAAPRIPRRITDGVLIFTPDASRDEAEEIVRGLNNHAEANGEKLKVNSKP